MSSSLPPCIGRRIPIQLTRSPALSSTWPNAANEWPLVLPLHPRTRQAAKQYGLDFGSIAVIDPVGYLDMIALLDGCTRVLTNSGGIAEGGLFLSQAVHHAAQCHRMGGNNRGRLEPVVDRTRLRHAQRNQCLRGRRGGREDRGDTRRGALNE